MNGDIAAFLAARLDEDEAAARATTERQPYDEWDAVGASDDDDIGRSNWRVVGIAIPGMQSWHAPAARSVMQHIARHDPVHVLREVEAKREILTAYIKAETDGLRGDGWIALRFSVETLVAVYSDHPDWREEWKP